MCLLLTIVIVYFLPIFLLSLLWTLSVPNFTNEAMTDHIWQQAMFTKMDYFGC